MKKTIYMYLNSDKDSNYEIGKELGLSDEAMEKFKYALYEVQVEVEVNTETGETEIIGFDIL